MITDRELNDFWNDFLLVGCAYPVQEQQQRLDRLIDRLQELKKLQEIDGWSEVVWTETGSESP